MNASEGKKEEIREDLLSISRENILEHAEDFGFLRREGIRMIEQLSGNVWTDYNATDPGITLLEAMCYALTDLGYRTLMEPQDILARDPAGEEGESAGEGDAGKHGASGQMGDAGKYGASAGEGDAGKRAASAGPLAHEILPSQPLTIADYRKLIIDTEGVKNAFIEPTFDNEVFLYYSGGPALDYVRGADARSVQLKGLYRVLVEFEYAVLRSGRQKEVIADVRGRLQAHRGLCEDFVVVSEVETELVPLDMKVVVHEGADIERVAAEILNLVQNKFSSGIPFYSLWQLQHKGIPTEEIFEGPLLKHGFIDTAELNASVRQTRVVLSDLINPILAIEGVIAIHHFNRKGEQPPAYFGERPMEEEPKKLSKMLRLDVEGSTIQFVRSGDRHRHEDTSPDSGKVLALYHFLQSQVKTTKLQKHRNHIEAPEGTFMDIARYRPFQQDLPVCYLDERKLLLEEEAVQIVDRWGDPGVEAIIQTNAPLKARPEDRAVQVLQLKGFLMVFEQLMADYCARLANIGRLFSDESLSQTYFPRILRGNIPDVEELYLHLSHFERLLPVITEPEEDFLKGRNAILDHLLARVAERIDPESLYPGRGRNSAGHALIRAKEGFVREYIQLSKNRGRGFNYANKQETWDTGNVAGVKKRICRLLGMEEYKTDFLTQDWITIDKHEHSQGVTRHAVVIRAEKGGRELLRSKGYDSDSETRNTLEFILRHGGDRKYYKTDHDRGKYFYELRRTNSEEAKDGVADRYFDTAAERDEHLEELLALLTGFIKKENFHLVEHLLLRPRLEPQEEDTGRPGHSNVHLLLPRVVPRGRAAAGGQPREQLYRFKWTREKIAGNKEIFKLTLVIKTAGEPVLFTVDDDFQYMEDLFERMRLMREAGADKGNYDPDRGRDGRRIFHLKDKNRVLARGTKTYTRKEDMEKEIEELVAFFSYEQTLQSERDANEEEQETIASDADPYSFQVSYFIPTWPLRLSDPSFRHVVEKCIATETPAHILPRVYWLDYKEMKDFETAYKPWLENIAGEGIPDTAVVNHFVGVMNHLFQTYRY